MDRIQRRDRQSDGLCLRVSYNPQTWRTERTTEDYQQLARVSYIRHLSPTAEPLNRVHDDVLCVSSYALTLPRGRAFVSHLAIASWPTLRLDA